MLLAELFSNPVAFAVTAIALVFALSWHEAAHALVAKWLGDDTAETMGRLTLNPLAHLDPIGTTAILIIGFGWGKPVPVNPNNFTNPRLDNLKVALAGPLSNLLLALIFAGLNALFRPDPNSLAGILTATIISFNLLLMLFNLIPIPPLDGSKIVHLFLSDEAYFHYERYGFYILLGLVFLSIGGYSILGRIVFMPAEALYRILTQGSLPGFF